ncbi:target of Nesh-SH3 isoform X8 [Pyxicephalus adspersus]|uniref:target of Nesh-SH3 isoform X8 n=1 Tax=Pyxicephalus adspersus TaxID=30357 RepID=UPI003B5BF094
MISRVFFLFLCGVISAHLGYAQKLPKVKKLNMKAHINITSDTLTMKFHRPNQSIKLEGFILGYGSNYFTNQYIQWPENGKSFVTDVDAETRYLIAVKPNENNKKTCKEKNSSQKPLQVVIGTLTPTSVFLSWGILINPQVDWSALSKCPNDRFYTVRYKEKNGQDWNFQLCPTTETVIDNLKPNTMYEFGVKDNSDDGIWGTAQTHKINPKGKENGNIGNTYKIPKGTLQHASEDTKALVPVIVVKQGFQNITKSTAAPPATVKSPVFREVTKKLPLTTTRPTPKPKPVSKVTEPPPIPRTSTKAITEDPKSAVTSQTHVESFTPDLSTGTLEWVRATMVTHPYIQVTSTQAESSVINEQSSTMESHGIPSEAPEIATMKPHPSLKPPKNIIAPTKTKVTESEVLSSTEEPHTKLEVAMVPSKQLTPQSPVPAQTRPTFSLASPTIATVPFTKELPVVQPETVLERDQLATYIPQPLTISNIIPAGEKPVSSEAPQLQSSTVSRHLLPEQHKTKAENLSLSIVPQVTLHTPVKLHTTSGIHPLSTLMPKKSAQLPFQKHTTTIGIHPISTPMPKKTTPFPFQKHTTTIGDVSEPIDIPQVSTEIPVKLHTTSGVHPVSTLIPKKSTHLPFQKHTTTIGDVSESIDEPQVSTEIPVKLRTTSGIHPISTLLPKKSTHLPFQKQTTTIGDVSESIDVPPVSTDRPVKLRTTSGKLLVSTLMPKKSTHLPFQKQTTTIGDESESIDVPPVSTDRPVKLRTTSAAKKEKPKYGSTTISSLEKEHTYHATTSQHIPAKHSTLSSQTYIKTTTAFVGSPNIVTTQQSFVPTAVPHSETVPNEMLSFEPKPVPSTEVPDSEADSTLPENEIVTTDVPHMYEPEKNTLALDDHTVVQKHTSTVKSRTTIAYRTTTIPVTTNTPTTSQRTQSTQASKRERVSPAQPKKPLPKQTQPTTVKEIQSTSTSAEETTNTLFPVETQKSPHKKDHSTVGPTPPTDPKTPRLFPPNILESDIFDHSKIPLVPGKTEKDVSSKSDKTTQSPPTTAAPKPAQTAKMPINLIRLHIFADPLLPSVQSETQPTAAPTSKTTQSNIIPQSKPAPKITKRVPIHAISLQIFDEADVPMVPNTTLTPSQSTSQSTTTKRPEIPHTTPVQKVLQPITQKLKPTPRTRTKPVPNTTLTPPQSTTTKRPESPHTTPVQKVQPITQKPKPTPRTRSKPATYRVHNSSSRPRTSLRPRTRPAHNGTTQGSSRPRPTGEFNWMSGTIPGGRALDSTKLLGVSRNISMEPNNTGKRTFSVSSPPLLPVKPTSIRRRIQNNVTGKPGVTVSSPPLPPVKPTSIRRRPPTNNSSKPAPAGGILIPRAPSTPKPNCTMVYIKPPKVQPTLPATDEDFVDPTVFSPSPKSDLDALGKPRFIGPHVKYINKDENVPCSITESLKHFALEESTNQEISTPPQNPPSNLTVVTVEGCSSFVILDWEMPDNDSVTEFKVISTENGASDGKNQSIITTNQTYSTVENLKPDTKYDFKVVPTNPLGEGPVSATVEFSTESADPRVSEPVSGGKDAIWTEIKFKTDSYSECKGKQYVKRTWYKKFVGIQLCNSLRYKIYLSNSLTGTFYNIGDQSGYGEDHCQFVDSFLDGRTGQQLLPEQLTTRKGFYRSVRQQPVEFGDIGGRTHISYVHWYECGIAIPGKW